MSTIAAAAGAPFLVHFSAADRPPCTGTQQNRDEPKKSPVVFAKLAEESCAQWNAHRLCFVSTSQARELRGS